MPSVIALAYDVPHTLQKLQYSLRTHYRGVLGLLQLKVQTETQRIGVKLISLKSWTVRSALVRSFHMTFGQIPSTDLLHQNAILQPKQGLSLDVDVLPSVFIY